MRVQVIGCGSIGRRHIGNLLALGCEVYAFDPSAAARDRTKADYPTAHVQWFGPYANVDACVIATPLGEHLVWVEEALRYQKPFFVEKPLGTLEQLPRWRALAALHLPVSQVGYQLRFHPTAHAVRERFPAPICGAFLVMCDIGTWPGTAYGAPLLELSHEIDLALWCGAPATVTEVLEMTGDAVHFALEGWHVGLYSRAQRYRREWSVGDGVGSYQAEFTSPEELGDEMYRDELAHFLLCVREGLPTNVPLADGLRVLEVCQQVEQLARQTA